MRVFRNPGFGIYLGEIQSDLSQVENLVGDAGAMLLAGFTNITSLARVQQRLAGELAAACARTGYGDLQHAVEDDTGQVAADQELSFSLALAQQAAIADRISQEVNRIVRALQFQDLTSQLLAHAKGRLAALESTLERISETAGASWPGKEAMEAFVATVGRHPEKEKAAAEIILFPRSKPVVQQGMATGDAELF